MRPRARLLVALAVVSCAALWSACAESDTVQPGFEELGGGGAGGGTETTSTSTGTGTTSTHTTSVTSTSTTGTTTSTSTGTTTGSGGSGGDGGGSGGECPDTGPGEPNDSESTAHDLGKIDDCDKSGSTVLGVISGEGDADWYKYEGDDTFGCEAQASRSFEASAGLRVCAFAQCTEGPVELTCPDGSADATSPDGRPGCCSLQGFKLDPDCTGIDDDAKIYIRLDSPDQLSCVSYELAYNY